MKPASDMRAGMIIRYSGVLHRVLGADYHAGGGKLPGVVHARIQNLETAHVTDQRFRPDERFEEVELERRRMEFIYEDSGGYTFMDPETYEQVTLPGEALGAYRPFIQPNETLQVAFIEEAPVDVACPADVTLRVESAPEPLAHQHDSNVMKEVLLENGMEVLAPQFIRTGDLVKIEVESGKYLERVK
jgi:elongation factor P